MRQNLYDCAAEKAFIPTPNVVSSVQVVLKAGAPQLSVPLASIVTLVIPKPFCQLSTIPK